MKLAARVVTALAVFAFATPAFPCGDKMQKTTVTTADAGTQPAGAVANADKAKKSEKSEKAKRAAAQRAAATN